MKFDRVRKEEADTVLKLYRSLLGTPYCVWTEDYPTEKEVEFDFSRDALFCMRDDDGNIIGARELLAGVMEELKNRGYQAVHLLVAKDNVKALRSYDKLNFESVGECELWGHMYWGYEKEL